MPQLAAGIATLVSGVQGLFVAGGFFTTTAGRVALGLALNLGADALRRSQGVGDRAMPRPAERMVSISQPMSEMRIVLGRTRIGGPKGLDKKGGGSRHYNVIFAAHPVAAVHKVWLDRAEQVLDADGEVSGSPQAGYANIRVYRGQPGQLVDPVFLSALQDVTTEFDFAGLSHLAITARNAPPDLIQTVYPNGRHWDATALVDGVDDVLDPRTGLRGWTRNPALLFAWVCDRFGVRTDPGEIARGADICDRPVTDRHGVTRARWTFDGVFDDGQDWKAITDEIAKCSDALIYERSDGAIGFVPGAWLAPSVVLTASSFRALRIGEGLSGAQAVTEVVVEYTSPANDYLEQPTGAWVADPAAVPNRLTVEAFGSDNHNQGWRLGVRALARRRAQYQIEGEIGILRYLELLRAMEGDGSGRFARLVHEELGRDIFVEIERLTLAGDGTSATLIGVSVQPGDFDPDPALEPDVPQRDTGQSDGEPVPVGLRLVSAGATSATATWPAQPTGYSTELVWRAVGGAWTTVAIEAGETSYTLSGLTEGVTYEVYLQNVSPLSVRSPGGETVTVVPAASSTAPGPVTDESIAESNGSALLEWTAPAAPYHRARIYRGTTATFGDAVVVRHELGTASAADAYLDQPGPGAWRYWIEAINANGDAATAVGPLNLTLS